MRHRHTESESGDVAINLTPLIDMVFILLIFFMVTSSFVKETGVDVDRPSAATAVRKERASILIAVTSKGEVWIDKRRVDLRAVRANVERLHAENPEGAVVILADEQAPTGTVVRVLDQARLAGVESVSIAASQDAGG
ncbi:MAG: biopolymer transporter ExbD [gamma proteobacterium endosymbiont of Lamellibrachia anaximandri]|uniref:Biopolymer transporter ExbD n=1 Tax=endosymbiont of Escarpia spicata TaxID=2200908 RepID=A0A370DH35_9GAMM|nr:biopolymer transporter ExbD [gamma proteobacterium endosymbiont of Lamellibrachia anaximandri]QYZ67815.1 MAG: biopolymer transporter ExbD [Gammaproteobacteria bacterium (ex Lamellibrachia satsuma)]RDH83637.1 MAG: biopolymer transporter ExbD [endosymbiont of Escarpia spicata]MBL3535449.1 biopolymer transporter ExbD [gamma proteobacterium endosymbiont of Lamellibrachia anaximandri]MBL3589663.1 biopolymer transporter ExbD [gamma proteobacterium endosymbiont of Lamellibrachia anaximandri]